MRPLLNTATRSDIDSASLWSWVTKMKVIPSDCCSFFSSTCICSRSFKSGAQRLIEQQHPRLVHQRPGNRDPLPLAAGELGGLAMMSKAKGHLLQRLGRMGAFFAMPLTIRP